MTTIDSACYANDKLAKKIYQVNFSCVQVTQFHYLNYGDCYVHLEIMPETVAVFHVKPKPQLNDSPDAVDSMIETYFPQLNALS